MPPSSGEHGEADRDTSWWLLLRQMAAMLRKNALLKKADWKQTLAEVSFQILRVYPVCIYGKIAPIHPICLSGEHVLTVAVQRLGIKVTSKTKTDSRTYPPYLHVFITPITIDFSILSYEHLS